jgi:hypothetical protein
VAAQGGRAGPEGGGELSGAVRAPSQQLDDPAPRGVGEGGEGEVEALGGGGVPGHPGILAYS